MASTMTAVPFGPMLFTAHGIPQSSAPQIMYYRADVRRGNTDGGQGRIIKFSDRAAWAHNKASQSRRRVDNGIQLPAFSGASI